MASPTIRQSGKTVVANAREVRIFDRLPGDARKVVGKLARGEEVAVGQAVWRQRVEWYQLADGRGWIMGALVVEG